ncbi:unnamed protein product [Symbiodinium natans]|uniref:Uncharacterized protein n=1 Tax=Symbiodinium natans TaxID=878477 RepID=A0A812I704_9DINO|nr:unnamed protein product [Symbiodinium natans]
MYYGLGWVGWAGLGRGGVGNLSLKRSRARVRNPGTVLEVSERAVVDGVLRLRVVRDSQRGAAGGWVSEFKRPVFDPRLGGAAQLLRLRGPPRSLGKKGPCAWAAFGVFCGVRPVLVVLVGVASCKDLRVPVRLCLCMLRWAGTAAHESLDVPHALRANSA